MSNELEARVAALTDALKLCLRALNSPGHAVVHAAMQAAEDGISGAPIPDPSEALRARVAQFEEALENWRAARELPHSDPAWAHVWDRARESERNALSGSPSEWLREHDAKIVEECESHYAGLLDGEMNDVSAPVARAILRRDARTAAAAREEGRRAGIEEAAQKCDVQERSKLNAVSEQYLAGQLAEQIRALATTPTAPSPAPRCRSTEYGGCTNAAMPGKPLCWQHGGDMVPDCTSTDQEKP